MKLERYNRYIKKLLHLKRYYDWLVEWLEGLTLEQLEETQDFRSLMGIYHTAQNAAATIIDITAMINKDCTNLVQDNYNNLEFLVHNKIITVELRNKLQNLIGLRNRLAHDYNGIIDIIAWEAIQDQLPSFKTFYDVIHKWLAQQQKTT